MITLQLKNGFVTDEEKPTLMIRAKAESLEWVVKYTPILLESLGNYKHGIVEWHFLTAAFSEHSCIL